MDTIWEFLKQSEILFKSSFRPTYSHIGIKLLLGNLRTFSGFSSTSTLASKSPTLQTRSSTACVDLSWKPYPRAIYGSIHAIQNFRCMILPWLPSFLYKFFFAFQRFHGGEGIGVQCRQGKPQTEHFWSLWLLYGIQEILYGIQGNLYGIQVWILYGIQEILHGNQEFLYGVHETFHDVQESI